MQEPCGRASLDVGEERDERERHQADEVALHHAVCVAGRDQRGLEHDERRDRGDEGGEARLDSRARAGQQEADAEDGAGRDQPADGVGQDPGAERRPAGELAERVLEVHGTDVLPEQGPARQRAERADARPASRTRGGGGGRRHERPRPWRGRRRRRPSRYASGSTTNCVLVRTASSDTPTTAASQPREGRASARVITASASRKAG